MITKPKGECRPHAPPCNKAPARACAAPEANNPKRLDLRPRKGKKLSRPTSAAPRAGSSRYGGPASSRNPWAQSSRYRRAASPESAWARVTPDLAAELETERSRYAIPTSKSELVRQLLEEAIGWRKANRPRTSGAFKPPRRVAFQID